jgi:HSP20 family protein
VLFPHRNTKQTYMTKKKSLLERFAGSMRMKDEDAVQMSISDNGKGISMKESKKEAAWEQEAELTVDVYQTATEIVVQSMVAGVAPENLSITITRDMITIRGKREENRSITEDNYYTHELYWGSFSRVISLPEEVDPEEAEAVETHGLLIIRLPKINKNKETNLKIKSI